MLLNFNIILPGLEGVRVTKSEVKDNGVFEITVEMPLVPHICPRCGEETRKVHDYRIQFVRHLKMAERPTILQYRKRRYACPCGKRFAEQNPFVDRYQRFSKEWNQQVQIRAVKAKTFTEIAAQYHTSVSTIIRRFDAIIPSSMKGPAALPEVIAIDEFKGNTGKEKYQLIIADAQTREPIDILPNRRKETIKDYLRKHGAKVQVVVMDMSQAFKAAVQQALDRPIIVADSFHFVRYINWSLDRVRVREQARWHEYDRKKCKKTRYIFHKAAHKLTEKDQWLLERYFSFSPELQKAYELKEAFYEWFYEAKRNGRKDMVETQKKLHAFYQKVEESGIPELRKTVQTYRNWEREILNRFQFEYSNGFVEGLNNLTKVIKRNGFGYRNFTRFRARILLHHQYKNIGNSLG
ncbi:MAG: ISL3 family transposase [Butyricimonas sp.]|nr:ISL3 family transposase [Butyricimonas sp.]